MKTRIACAYSFTCPCPQSLCPVNYLCW